MNHECDNFDLSPDGHARRDAMRAELLDVFDSMMRTRIIRRRVVAGAAVFTLAAGTLWAGSRYRTAPATHTVAVDAAPASLPFVEIISTPATGRAIEFAYVDEGSRGLVQVIDSQMNFVQMIDDSTLIETLAQMDRPAGLIEIGGRVELTRDVADDAGSAPPSRGSHLPDRVQPGNSSAATGV